MEQGELRFDAPASPVKEKDPVEEILDFGDEPEGELEMEPMVPVARLSLREPRPVPSATKRPVVTRPGKPAAVPMATSRREAPRQIARYLTANGVLHGMQVETVRFALPGRGLTSRLNLWRGSPDVGQAL